MDDPLPRQPGPWDQPDAQPAALQASAPPVSRRRLWLWLAFLAAIGAIVWAMVKAFPEATQTKDDQASILYQLGVVALITAGLMRAGRGTIRQHLKHAAIWAGIAAVLALGYAYRAELAGVTQRLALTFNVGTPVVVGERELVVPQDDSGAFVIVGQVNGQRVRFMVDTGATETVLSPDDARRLGLDVDRLDYGYEAETANGKGYGAAYTARSLEVGPIRLDDFRMTVNKAPMSGSLLGMSFLKRLDAFEFRGRTLTLKWHEDAAGRAK